jgi:hypothetical protein
MGEPNVQRNRTLQQTRTSLPPGEVLTAAKQFFLRRNSIYPAFLEQEGATYVTFRGQGGEELIIGVAGALDGAGATVTGSTYRFDSQIARFFSTLPPSATGNVA